MLGPFLCLLPWLWLLLLDLAHLRQIPEQVVLSFGLQSLPGFLLPLFLLAQLLLHLLPLVQLLKWQFVGRWLQTRGWFFPSHVFGAATWVEMVGKRVRLKVWENLATLWYHIVGVICYLSHIICIYICINKYMCVSVWVCVSCFCA